MQKIHVLPPEEKQACLGNNQNYWQEIYGNYLILNGNATSPKNIKNFAVIYITDNGKTINIKNENGEITKFNAINKEIKNNENNEKQNENNKQIKFIKNHYEISEKWIGNKNIIIPPNEININIAGESLNINQETYININDPTAWDEKEYIYEEKRAGKDFYIYAVNDNKNIKFIISKNDEIPIGNKYKNSNTRKIAGFHCLAKNVGNIKKHKLNKYNAGDIIPASMWDIIHRPIAKPESMVYCENIRLWIDIYMTDINGTAKIDQEILIGKSWTYYCQILAKQNKRLLFEHEFQVAAQGSNEQSSISTQQKYNGAYEDQYYRRMISDIGCEAMCGQYQQWLLDSASANSKNNIEEWIECSDISEKGKRYRIGENSDKKRTAGGAKEDNEKCGTLATNIENIEKINNNIAARGCSLPKIHPF